MNTQVGIVAPEAVAGNHYTGLLCYRNVVFQAVLHDCDAPMCVDGLKNSSGICHNKNILSTLQRFF